MTQKKIFFSALLLVFALSPFLVQAQELNFNSIAAEQNLFLLKNETRGAVWAEQIGADPGDKLSLKIYYHCGAKFSNQPLESAKNSKIRVTFPSSSQSVVVLSAQVLSDNAFSASDNGILNLSSSQKIVFDATAQWFRNQDALISDIPVTITETAAEVNLGDLGCDYAGNYANAGSVVFKAHPGGPVLPKVTLKANGFDDRLYLDYNSQATLTWMAEGADSCLAGGDWTGSRPTTGSEMTSDLLTSKNYTLICASSRGQEQDTVKIVINLPQTLSVALTSNPASGPAPLNGVDLKATVSGTAQGTINYKLDCTSDGSWDYKFDNVSDNPKTVIDACNYANPGVYNALVRVERGTAVAAQAAVPIVVGVVPVGGVDINLVSTGRNLSDGTDFQNQVLANPGEVVEFRLAVTAGIVPVNDLVIRDTLPDKMNYYGGLKLDGVAVSGNILNGLNIGNLQPQQTKVITFQATVSGTKNFGFGATDLVNAVLAYNTGLAKTSTNLVEVTKTEVKGATTVPTGPLDSMKLAFLLSLALGLLLSYFFLARFYFARNKLVYLDNQPLVLGMDGFAAALKMKAKNFLTFRLKDRAAEKLARTIEEIRKMEPEL